MKANSEILTQKAHFLPEQQEQAGHLNRWFCALMVFVIIFISIEFNISTRDVDICQAGKCKSSYEYYMAELGQKEAQWEKFVSKEGEYKELKNDIRKCMRQIEELKSVGKEGEEASDEELKKIHVKIDECSAAIEYSLKEIRSLVERDL